MKNSSLLFLILLITISCGTNQTSEKKTKPLSENERLELVLSEFNALYQELLTFKDTLDFKNHSYKMRQRLNKAIDLRSQKKYADAEILLKELICEYPNNAQVYYHYAWLCDNMERETEARPKYEKALELGLTGEDLKGCYLGLGSTYRCIGEYEKSITLFDNALEAFPSNNEYKVFKAMALYNLENHQGAMNLLLNVIAGTSSDEGIQEYKEAIEYYSDNLDKKFN